MKWLISHQQNCCLHVANHVGFNLLQNKHHPLHHFGTVLLQRSMHQMFHCESRLNKSFFSEKKSETWVRFIWVNVGKPKSWFTKVTKYEANEDEDEWSPVCLFILRVSVTPHAVIVFTGNKVLMKDVGIVLVCFGQPGFRPLNHNIYDFYELERQFNQPQLCKLEPCRNTRTQTTSTTDSFYWKWHQ